MRDACARAVLCCAVQALDFWAQAKDRLRELKQERDKEKARQAAAAAGDGDAAAADGNGATAVKMEEEEGGRGEGAGREAAAAAVEGGAEAGVDAEVEVPEVALEGAEEVEAEAAGDHRVRRLVASARELKQRSLGERAKVRWG